MATEDLHIPETKSRGSVVVAVVAGAAALAGSYILGTRASLPGGTRTFDGLVITGLVVVIAGQAWHARRLEAVAHHVNLALARQESVVSAKITDLTEGVAALVVLEKEAKPAATKLIRLPGGGGGDRA